MANTSIYAAFERMWLHITSVLGNKADITALDAKVDKVEGKGLSTSDYTTAEKSKLSYTNIGYGTCSTAAGTAAKVINVVDNANWALMPGSIITILFSATNTAQRPTFNVNNTGAKSVQYGSSVITTSSLNYAGYKDRPMTFVYDGSEYVFSGWGYDSNTTYTNEALGQGQGTCTTAAATVAKAVKLSGYALTTGGIVAVKFTYDVPAFATLNINSKGAKAVYHRGAEITGGVIKAGDTATFIYNGICYHLISIDRSTEYAEATTSTAGLMSAADKTTFNAIPNTYATKAEVPTIEIVRW